MEKFITAILINAFALLFLEAEENTDWIKDETIHVPSNEEMKEYLMLEEYE